MCVCVCVGIRSHRQSPLSIDGAVGSRPAPERFKMFMLCASLPQPLPACVLIPLCVCVSVGEQERESESEFKRVTNDSL